MDSANEEKLNADSANTVYKNKQSTNANATSAAIISTPLPSSVANDVKPSSSSSSSSSPSALVIVRDYLWRVFILEPPVFLIYVAIYLSSTVYQNQLLYYSCTNVYHHSPEECKPLLGVETITDEAKIALAAGMGIGNMLSGYIYAASGAVIIFIVASCLILLALIYLLLAVPESLQSGPIQTGSKIREFFHWELVADLVKVATKTRPNCDRPIIWLTMTALTLVKFASEGDTTVTDLFFRKKFEWTLKDFSTFSVVGIGIQVLGCVLAVIVLRRLLKLSIITMTLVSLACCVMESTVRACAAYWWQLYMGLVLGFMRGIVTPMARAILSHVVPITEIGKIFALTTSLETISPLISAPLYTTVYNANLSFYPGLFNIISAALYLLDFIFIAIIYGIRRSYAHTTSYQEIGSKL